MQLVINVPSKPDILNGGFQVPVAAAGLSWSFQCLGDYAGRSGVYVHHAGGDILYVGKTTTGDWGNFGERLRREFQQTSASDSFLYRLLASQTEVIRSYLLDLDQIDALINAGALALNKVRKALLMEQVLIGVYEPRGNRA